MSLDRLRGSTDDLDGVLVLGEIVVKVFGDLLGVGREEILVPFESTDIVVVEADELLAPPDLLLVETNLPKERIDIQLLVQTTASERLLSVVV
jgi:hypothetical protein